MDKPDKNDLIFNRSLIGDKYPYYNISDVRRINEHLAYLSEHYGTSNTSPAWDPSVVPNKSDFQKMLDSVKRVRDVGVRLSTTPPVPSTVGYDYRRANDVEQILYDLELLIDNVYECYKYSGTFASGQEVVL